ncbi:hypothetical protein HBI56_230850 [Parastagonospora nodorum]|uniref:SCP domain-containing protein n=2 Tax=Phaeosphaeria nodorum (strain SN15 / ATCC MYA-4574 / FGSC 10173) TaxID=321614 RepID=A0A7U2I726_PHANO|nr:hypothetical protein SNOG_16134 [Parastagonospora nodorum SN15]KAH3905094.1 hypothetical protein HBH56_223790 [Parastagonospora nodorum]EAT76506.1 hypothetical protein SNOG_16134 [Parastagonospora nodorum SN15]KAH3921911.1 hypothetical protein HBH54_231940 [Parastagonospora nodorum]KAH3939426.1 hypothetical protein HBH53_234860 [Parastagonospora nodorum]KAH3959992.1 hypothetical protein HBH52_240840 [Parastagonospora nodorum]
MRFAAFLVALAAATAVAALTVDVKPRDLIDDDAPHQDDPDFISAVMRAHWYWRRLHCAQDLVWDPELAKQARADVAKCPDKPTHERPGSNLSSVKPAPKGHAEWVAFARGASHGWHEEETQYPYDNPHFSDAWGHFSQMVWRNSSSIGCAVGHCNDAKNPVQWPGRFYCYYNWYGNNVAEGQFREQVWGPVCHDPSVGEVKARQNVAFDWTARTQ